MWSDVKKTRGLGLPGPENSKEKREKRRQNKFKNGKGEELREGEEQMMRKSGRFSLTRRRADSQGRCRSAVSFAYFA